MIFVLLAGFWEDTFHIFSQIFIKHGQARCIPASQHEGPAALSRDHGQQDAQRIKSRFKSFIVLLASPHKISYKHTGTQEKYGVRV